MAVATESGPATKEAMAILAAGGNAVDAAVCAALVGGVTSPTSSGIGGGGFAVVWLASEKRAVALDFRETAPAAISGRDFERRPLQPAERGKLVGVPGEVAGLYELQRRYGKRSWADLVQRAERIARQGFAVEAHLASVLVGSDAPKFQRDPALREFLYPGGKAAVLGQRLRRPALARTLASIAQQGPKAFYSGPVAAGIAAVVRASGGELSESDFATYAVKERKPLSLAWEGLDVFTMPAPSGGGLMLAETLSMLSRAELAGLGLRTPRQLHVLAEVMRGALADRYRYIGDPEQVSVDLAALLQSDRLAKRKAMIVQDRTHAAPVFAGQESGTHAISVLDAEGNAVAMTTTVNTAFGADLLDPRSGVILNDQLDDFTSEKDARNFGPDNPNRARPGARPVSSMTPTIVVAQGRVLLAIGASGGTSIPASVIQVLIANLAFGEPIQRAVSAPRVVPQTGVPTLRLEDDFSERERAELAWRGERTAAVTSRIVAVQVVRNDESGAQAAADPRKHGVALVK